MAQNSIRILLIDDDEDDYLLARDLVSEIAYQKYTLEWESNIEAARTAIRNKSHDVYLIDYQLGVINGIELVREAVKSGCDSPLILLTGQGAYEIDREAMDAGAIDYLNKSLLDPYQLDRSIRYSLQHAKSMREIRTLNVELELRVQERTEELAEAIKELKHSNKSLQNQIRETKLAEEALKVSQQLYSNIVSNFPNGTISVVDREMHYIFIDGKELNEGGNTSEHYIGNKITDFLSRENGRVIMKQLEKCFNGKSVNFNMELGDKHFVFNAVPFREEEGQVTQVLLVSKNITEQKRTEEKIRKALEKEKELSVLKSRFVTMASHEFRTPLSAILSSASLAAKYCNPEQEEKRVKHLNRIKSSVRNLNGILNDFLSMGKLEEGKIESKVQEFDLETLALDLIEEVQALASQDQRIHYAGNHLNSIVCTDQHLLKNIILNLLSNAVKYSRPYGNIYLQTNFKKNNINISIRDEGIGISEEDQKHLFQRFFRASNATNIQGTGLGLHIVKKYIDLLNGKIKFESKLNEGSLFEITIPQSNQI